MVDWINWNRVIEFPQHPLTFEDVMDILLSELSKEEAEILAKELICFHEPVERILETWEYEVDC